MIHPAMPGGGYEVAGSWPSMTVMACVGHRNAASSASAASAALTSSRYVRFPAASKENTSGACAAQPAGSFEASRAWVDKPGLVGHLRPRAGQLNARQQLEQQLHDDPSLKPGERGADAGVRALAECPVGRGVRPVEPHVRAVRPGG